MLLFNTIARGISFVLSIILAKNFLPLDTDVYLYVWSLINVVMVIISAINLMAAGPEYIRLCESGELTDAANLNSAFINIYLFPLVVFSLFTLLFPIQTYSVISGFEVSQLLPAKEMLRFSGLWLVMVVLNNFLGNVLLSRKYFVGSIVGQALAAGVTLLFILISKNELGISSFFIGQIIGNTVCLLFYIYQLRTRINEKFRLLYFQLGTKVYKELVAAVLIAVPTLISNFILVYLLSHLITGQLSAYNYGSTLANLPDVIILSQFISIIGVKFSEISASKQNDVLFRALRYFGNHLFFVMSGIAVIISLTSPILIQVFYGKDNLGTSTFNSATLTLTLISSTLAFKALDTLHNRVFASLQALSVLMKYTVPLKILSIGLLILLANLFQFNGILIHQLMMPLIMVILQFYLLSKYLPGEKIQAYIGQIMLLFFGSLLVYAGCRFLLSYVLMPISPILQVLIICAIVLVIGFVFEKIFKMTMLFEVVIKRALGFVKAEPDTGNANG